jgi:hypothetical protein
MAPAKDAEPESGSDLTAILRRLQTLEDERSILRTLYSYGHCYDYNDHAGWLDCFTDDAKYQVMISGGKIMIACEGRRQLEDWIRNHPHPAERWTQHLLMEPMIAISGDQAKSVAYFVRTDDHAEVPYISATGRYFDELARCRDGGWRFTSRRAELETVVGARPPAL